MTEDELRDWAYHESTGNHLTDSFSYKEFQKIKAMDYVWEPFEYWDEDSLRKQIRDVAKSIISTAKEYNKRKENGSSKI